VRLASKGQAPAILQSSWDNKQQRRSIVNVLFDLDGTLTDPREGIVACFKHALHGLNCCAPPDTELERYIGPPLQECFASLLGSERQEQIDAAVALYRQRFSTKGIFENTVIQAFTPLSLNFRPWGQRSMLQLRNLACSRSVLSITLVLNPIFE
jgi:hypothetical protein